MICSERRVDRVGCGFLNLHLLVIGMLRSRISALDSNLRGGLSVRTLFVIME